MRKKYEFRSWSNSPVYKNNLQPGEEQAYNTAVETLRNIKSLVSGVLFIGPIRLAVEAFGNKRADMDNVFKAVADSLQGVAYENDKQIWEGSFKRKD